MKLSQPRAFQTFLQSLAEDEVHPALTDHLSYETLEALVDNELDSVEREIATLHMESCSSCNEEFRDLQTLKEPHTISPVEPVPTTQGAKESVLLFRERAWFTWPKLAAAAIVVAVAIGLIWVYKNAPQQIEIAESTPSSASPLPSIETPARPAPNPSAEILVSLNDAGGKFTLDNMDHLEGPTNVPATSTAAVKSALISQQLRIDPDLNGLKGKKGTLMGTALEGVPIPLIEPVGSVVRSDRPSFRWQPLAGATEYVVRVFDTNFAEVAKSEALTDQVWRVSTRLPRGRTYLWQITAIKDGQQIKSPTPPASEAKFKVISMDLETRIRQAQAIKPNSHLTLGVLYAEAGFLKDAEREFRLLLKANPDSPVARKFVQQVVNAR